jgi:hypothetical protein
VTIVEQVEAVRMLIDPRLLPTRRRPYRRMVAAVVVVVAAAVGDAELFADRTQFNWIPDLHLSFAILFPPF